MVNKKIVSLAVITTLVLAMSFFAYKLYFPKSGYTIYQGEPVKLYMSPYCGCCANYVDYLQEQGILVKKVTMNDISSIKNQYDIPRNMQSCHTVVFGEYFVEGHVPIEAINKLLEEKPDIAGIALPEMPDGSPGMSGFKRVAFNIYAVGQDGTISLFTSV